jgi:GNAT superfamily N-acetyltransferase
MTDLPPGWATDLAVLEHGGSVIEHRDDHLLVRTPENPNFHWGNCLLVTDRHGVDDAERWVDTFHRAFPAATWTAIGLTRMPDDQKAWTEQGLELSLDEVLSTRALPRQTPLPPDYSVRRLQGDDWEQSVALDLAENDRTGEYEPRAHEQFVRTRVQSQRALCERDVAAFFGAFAADALVAELGIVRCATVARYQNVGTQEQHRRRGLAAHLLGVAARWAGDRGCDQWVIVTEAVNPAGRVYRAVGFEPDAASVQAYRRPPR